MNCILRILSTIHQCIIYEMIITTRLWINITLKLFFLLFSFFEKTKYIFCKCNRGRAYLTNHYIVCRHWTMRQCDFLDIFVSNVLMVTDFDSTCFFVFCFVFCLFVFFFTVHVKLLLHLFYFIFCKLRNDLSFFKIYKLIINDILFICFSLQFLTDSWNYSERHRLW